MFSPSREAGFTQHVKQERAMTLGRGRRAPPPVLAHAELRALKLQHAALKRYVVELQQRCALQERKLVEHGLGPPITKPAAVQETPRPPMKRPRTGAQAQPSMTRLRATDSCDNEVPSIAADGARDLPLSVTHCLHAGMAFSWETVPEKMHRLVLRGWPAPAPRDSESGLPLQID